jgi:two-component system, NtrC family, C4-dicarboxylate transport response regulator DctD
MARDWPGNVRELRNVADRLVLGIERVSTGPVGEAAPARSLKERVEQFERAAIAEALEQHGGAVSAASDELQIGKATLYEKIKRYGLGERGEVGKEGG